VRREFWVVERQPGCIAMTFWLVVLFVVATLLGAPVTELERVASTSPARQVPMLQIAGLVGMSYGTALLLDLIAGRGGGSRWWVKLVRPAVLVAVSSLLGVLIFEYLGPNFLGSQRGFWHFAFVVADICLSFMWYHAVRGDRLADSR